jgi:hypothetical protein
MRRGIRIVTIDFESAAAVALINVVVGGIFSLVIRKPFVDAAQSATRALGEAKEAKAEVVKLRETRVADLEGRQEMHRRDMDRRMELAAASRKGMHEQIAQLESNCVTREACTTQHDRQAQTMAESSSRIVEAVRQVGVVEERVTSTANFLREVNDRQIGLMQDLARIEGVVRAQSEPRKGRPQ